MNKNLKSVIEITDTHVKFIQAKNVRSKPAISACELRALSHFTDDEVVKLMAECVYTKNVPQESLILVIPRRWAILRQLSLPSHQDAEIEKMLKLQLVNQTPYDIEDIIFGYELLERLPTGYSKVLVIIIQKEVAKRYLALAARCGLHPGQLYLSSNGLLDWLLFQESKKTFDIKSPIAVINVDASSTEISFINDKKMYFSRQITLGSRDLNGDSLLNYYDQLDLSFVSYKKEHMGPEPKKVFLISTVAEAVLLKDKIEKEMKIPVDVLSGTESVLGQKNINLASLKNQSGISLGVPLGFLLSEASKPVNLMPQEVRDTKKSHQRRKELIQLAVLSVLIVVVGVLSAGIKLYQKSAIVSDLEGKIALTKDKISSAEKIVDFSRKLEKELAGRPFLPDVIMELYKLAPPEVSFRSIQLVERNQFSLQGYAETGSGVTEFQTKMLKSPFFKDVSLQFATKRRIFNSEVTDFKINCRLVSPGGE